jgi:hypothetical protein
MILEEKITKRYKGISCPSCMDTGFGKLFRWEGEKKFVCWKCLQKVKNV